MKRLLLTCTDLMAIQFMVPHMRYLSEHGFSVELACSVVGNRLEDLQNAVGGIVKIHTVRLVRSPYSPKNLNGYADLKKLLAENRYDVIWTNEPVMGVMTRLAARKARKNGTKVVYMAHGFHFYKGAPLYNWMIWATIEKAMAVHHDLLVTINHEDCQWAEEHTRSVAVRHIDGIGVDITRKKIMQDSYHTVRKELGVRDSDIMLLSVGELQTRKNHESVIRAVSLLQDPNVRYFICGKGKLESYLKELIRSLHLEKQVFLLGYRKDVLDLMSAADIFVHPSRREGLGLVCLEAMAVGKPLVTSNVQGIPDYVKNGITGYLCDPMDVERYTDHIRLLIRNPELRGQIGQNNLAYAEKYKIENIQRQILQFLQDLSDPAEKSEPVTSVEQI